MFLNHYLAPNNLLTLYLWYWKKADKMILYLTGDFKDCSLPEKKVFGTKNQEFIDSSREPFEQYLQVLEHASTNCSLCY